MCQGAQIKNKDEKMDSIDVDRRSFLAFCLVSFLGSKVLQGQDAWVHEVTVHEHGIVTKYRDGVQC